MIPPETVAAWIKASETDHPWQRGVAAIIDGRKIGAPGYEISIIAGEDMYSEPRRRLPSLLGYDEVEVGVRDLESGDLVSPAKAGLHMIADGYEFEEDRPGGVTPYVPITKLLNALSFRASFGHYRRSLGWAIWTGQSPERPERRARAHDDHDDE